MAAQARQKETTRQALLDAALRLSADRGFSALSLRAIAKEAGLAPTSFYRHFENLDDLGLALVDEVGLSLRRLVRQARRRTQSSETASVTRLSIETFMEFAETKSHLFRLLLGEGAGSTPDFRKAIGREIQHFTDDLVEDLEREAEAKQRPIIHTRLAAEAMVTVAFNLGAGAIDLPPDERLKLVERIIAEVRIIMRGAEAMAAGWEPGPPSQEPD